jgi:DNA primase
LSKHRTKCIRKVDDNDSIVQQTSENIRNYSNISEASQTDLFDFEEKRFDSSFSAKKISFGNINFQNTLKSSKNYASSSNFSNENITLDNLEDMNLEDMSFELADNTNTSINFEVDLNANILDEFENTLHEYEDIADDFSLNEEISEDIQNNSEDDFSQKNDEFPNEAYADLMLLVTKYKLSNAAGNAIISFFNKHSNHSTSPLPTNIKQGKLYMNNMKSNLSYMKTEVLDHNNTKYFLYHVPLISCIKKILEVPDISETFIFEYEELYKTTKVNIYLILFIKIFILFLLIYFI